MNENNNHQGMGGTRQPLIATMWEAIKAQHVALSDGRRIRSDDDPSADEQKLRSAVLLLASVAACSMADLELKVMIAAILRDDVGAYASFSHALRMVESAIRADMEAP